MNAAYFQNDEKYDKKGGKIAKRKINKMSPHRMMGKQKKGNNN